MEPRERLALPLKVMLAASGVTRDISGAGLFFVVEGQHILSGPVEFEMRVPEISLRFTSSGEIVRVEHEHGTTGVAVRFVDPRLDVMTEETWGCAGDRARTAHAASIEQSFPIAQSPEGSTK